MKPAVIREMTTDEVRDRLAEEKAALAKLELNHKVSPLENPLSIRSKRKLVARLSTEANKRKS